MKKIHVLSFGGGVNSSALFFYLLDRKLPLDLIIFSDTGEETQETYDAVQRMKFISEKNNVPLITVRSKKGRLVDYYMKQKAVPSLMFRDCTTKFKISPLRKYLRETYGKKQNFIMYIGIARDEMHRMRESDVKYIENSFPFVTDKIDRKGNESILLKHGFVAEKSGCEGCIYLSKLKFMRLKKNRPEVFKRWMLLEENGSRYPEITLNPAFKLRDLWEQTTFFTDETDEDNSQGCGSSYCFI